MNGGQRIVTILKNTGIQHLFTLCGGHIGPIYVEAAKAGMQVWDVRSEAAAVFAADAVARITGVPGVAAVTAGPGVTNSVTAVKNAQLARSPVLLLGGAAATLLRHRGALQDIDQIALLHSAVKFAARANYLREVAPLVHRALRIAHAGLPGPVFLEFPVDLLYPEETVREWYGKQDKKPAGLGAKLQQTFINWHLNDLFAGKKPDLSGAKLPETAGLHTYSIRAVWAAARRLKRAEKPVLLLGSGAMLAPKATAELASAVNSLGIPVYLSGMARGLLGHRSPIQYMHQRKNALREADLIILAGIPTDFRLDYGRSLGRGAYKIAVNRNRKNLHKNLYPQQAVCADPGAFLIKLAGYATGLPDWSEWKNTLHQRDALREAEIADMAKEPIEGINPLALLRHLEEVLPDNSVLVVDGGDFVATAAYSLHPRKPLSWLDPGVFGTLGAGGGFALGAAICYPDDYIWIIYGDGSVAYSLAEFETLAKNGLKVCGIVGNNGAWEQIARDQRKLLGAETAVTLPRTDYHRVAEGYGAAGERVDSLDGFQQAIGRAIASMDKGVPYLINAMIGSTAFREGSISI